MTATNCSICLESFSDPTSELDCGHKFHYACILQWLEIVSSCPLCRQITPYLQNPVTGDIIRFEALAVRNRGRRFIHDPSDHSLDDQPPARRNRTSSSSRPNNRRPPLPLRSIPPITRPPLLPRTHSWCVVPLMAAAQGLPHHFIHMIAHLPSFHAAVNALRGSPVLARISPVRHVPDVYYAAADQDEVIADVFGEDPSHGMDSPLAHFMQEAIDFAHTGLAYPDQVTMHTPVPRQQIQVSDNQEFLPPREVRNIVWTELHQRVRRGAIADSIARIVAEQIMAAIDAWESNVSLMDDFHTRTPLDVMQRLDEYVAAVQTYIHRNGTS